MTSDRGPVSLPDVNRLCVLMLVTLIGAAFLAASSTERVDWLGIVGLSLLLGGVVGAYLLGRRRGRSG